MTFRLAALCAAALLTVACECGDTEEVTTSTHQEDACTGPVPGSAADFLANVDDRVFFAFDKSDLTASDRCVLEKQAAWLLKYPKVTAEIAGYCDARGTVEYNDKLGQRRADSSKSYLCSLGVDSCRLSTISYGNRVTLVPGTTEEDYAQNRTAITTIK